MLHRLAICGFVLILAASMACAPEVFIHFEDMSPGATVEGAGAATPVLTISSTTGKAIVVRTGVSSGGKWDPLFP